MSVGVVHHRWDLPLIGQSSVVLSDATAANCDGDATAAKHQLGHRCFSLDPRLTAPTPCRPQFLKMSVPQNCLLAKIF